MKNNLTLIATAILFAITLIVYTISGTFYNNGEPITATPEIDSSTPNPTAVETTREDQDVSQAEGNPNSNSIKTPLSSGDYIFYLLNHSYDLGGSVVAQNAQTEESITIRDHTGFLHDIGISPDNRFITWVELVHDNKYQTVLYDIKEDTTQTLSLNAFSAAWSPNGDSLLLASDCPAGYSYNTATALQVADRDEGSIGLYTVDPKGGAKPTLITCYEDWTGEYYIPSIGWTNDETVWFRAKDTITTHNLTSVINTFDVTSEDWIQYEYTDSLGGRTFTFTSDRMEYLQTYVNRVDETFEPVDDTFTLNSDSIRSVYQQALGFDSFGKYHYLDNNCLQIADLDTQKTQKGVCLDKFGLSPQETGYAVYSSTGRDSQLILGSTNRFYVCSDYLCTESKEYSTPASTNIADMIFMSITE